jgi:hypothetical protein
MPNPRTPQARARITGRELKDPARFEKRSDPNVGPLGDPPAWMTAQQRIAWETFRAEIPWLAESDRSLTGIAATIQARLMAGEDVGVQALNLLRQCLGQMGATPADRSKIAVPNEQSEDPAERFFN